MVLAMDWQQPVALLIVATAAGGLLWRQFRPRKPFAGGHDGCGCAGPSGPAQKGSIVFHARRGERPKVIVKQG
jgi:hypothetical protein